ncbi:hypothetical protein EYC80_009837 [Monilinia laxa]|uniref:Uncharacterized protein n=1 Tax=Monilinia laxa TaxID=61186 RepID=A0A5N6JRH4_MONLA|nr:hypothetical protein EYC80_009837 [Monilinia laxa]
MLDAHNNTKYDLESKAFLAKNCQSLFELCQKPVAVGHEVCSAPITNLELKLLLVDRALEAKSMTRVPENEVGIKMTDTSKEEMLLKLLGSMKSLVDVMAKGDVALASKSLEHSNKKRKRGTE